MKIFMILNHNKTGINEKPFVGEKFRRISYEAFGKVVRKYGFTYARSSLFQHVGKGVFRTAWQYDGTWKKVHNIKPDVIYNKSNGEFSKKIFKEIAPFVPIFNDLLVDAVASNKEAINKFIPEYTIKGFTVMDAAELRVAAKKIPTEKLVLKPVFGSEAKGIHVVTKSTLPAKVPPYTFVQEFFDASYGVPGITKKVSDLRLIMVNGKIKVSFVREAKDGFFTNQSKGGRLIMVSQGRIPQNVKKIAQKVDAKLKKHRPRIYTIDFVFNKTEQPKIMELNSKPSFNYAVINRLDLLRSLIREFMPDVIKMTQQKKK